MSFDRGADIDHGVALQHAELEIIEIGQLHRAFLTFCAELAPESCRAMVGDRANPVRR